MTALKFNQGSPDLSASASVFDAANPPDALGLYLHVPFCLRKCPYCSFYSLPGRADLYDRYIQAVIQQMRQVAQVLDTRKQPLTSIFFGGGTPTLLPPAVLSGLLAECLIHFHHASYDDCNDCDDALEISIEVNPATVDAAALRILRKAGFNRLSIGAQSLHDRELKLLGRPHSAKDVVRTVALARQAGFANINLDLMYGLPEQTLSSWRETLGQALDLQPQHLSIYELTLEAGTPFARQREQGNLPLPEEDSVLLMLDTTRQMLTRAGLARYEISNYAKPGFQCKHNINYWRNGSYIGLGPSAAASLGGTRYTAIHDVNGYCECMENEKEIWQDKESLAPEASFRETVIMELRMTEGVSLAELRRRFGINAAKYYGKALERLLQLDLLEIVQGRLRLTAQGLLLADTVMAELV